MSYKSVTLSSIATTSPTSYYTLQADFDEIYTEYDESSLRWKIASQKVSLPPNMPITKPISSGPTSGVLTEKGDLYLYDIKAPKEGPIADIRNES